MSFHFQLESTVDHLLRGCHSSSLNWRLSNCGAPAIRTKQSVKTTGWLWQSGSVCVRLSVTVCVSMFEQEPCPPYPFQSHTQQWTYRCAGLLINSPVEPFNLKGCYISLAAENIQGVVEDVTAYKWSSL